MTGIPDNVLWEGPCCYAVRTGKTTCDIVVYSSSSVTHITVEVGKPIDAKTARTVERLNRYPANTRRAFSLI